MELEMEKILEVKTGGRNNTTESLDPYTLLNP